MGLNIDLYCNDGSPIGVTPPDIYGRGVGGAELAMMTWAEVMARRSHLIRIYNDPSRPDIYNGVYYRPKSCFDAEDKSRDVFILFRSPNLLLRVAQAQLKIHWSTDQETVGDYGRDIVPFADKIVCISPFHAEYYQAHYGGNSKIGYIDLGTKLDDYRGEVEKIPGRCIFCSVPDRGLEVLKMLWKKIKQRVPEASLVITSDYRLWGVATPRNHKHRLAWAGTSDVEFLGKVERHRLIREQMMAVCQPYPCTYEELFCISAAECQVAGAIPVTSAAGALRTTNRWGTLLDGNVAAPDWQRHFIDAVVEAINQPAEHRAKMQAEARAVFDWDIICEQWEKLIETGEF